MVDNLATRHYCIFMGLLMVSVPRWAPPVLVCVLSTHPPLRENPLRLLQGFKVVIRDIGLHMSNRVMDYCKEDVGLCRGALESRRRSPVPPVKTDFSSVQEFLESSQFVQVSPAFPLKSRLTHQIYSLAPAASEPPNNVLNKIHNMLGHNKQTPMASTAIYHVVCWSQPLKFCAHVLLTEAIFVINVFTSCRLPV